MTNHTDFVSVMVVIATLFFSPKVAAIVGPYFAIILASSVGASFSLARREPTTRMLAVMFFVRIIGLASLLTVGVASLLHAYTPVFEERWLVAPIALIVGYVGDDWGSLLAWAGRKINALVDGLIKLKTGGGNG
jgi:hypothetical protein